MNVYEIRKDNLHKIADTRFAGNRAALARAIGVKQPQLARWLSDTAKEGRRITEDSARKIEKKLELPGGALDNSPMRSVAHHIIPRQNPVIAEVAELMGKMDDVGRGMVLAYARTTAEEWPARANRAK